jgi:hypothetical protein
MQCPDCGYISFKIEKNCGSCGFNLKKAATSPASLFRNDSFTIFSSPKSSEEEQESLSASTPQTGEDITVIDPPESSQENPELKSVEFLLDLSATNKEEPETNLKSYASVHEVSGFIPMEFGTDADINLEEMEAEGLGLGLEPLKMEPPITPTNSKTEPEDNLLEISEEPKVSNSNSEDIILDIIDLDDSSSIESLALEEDKNELKIVPSSSQNQEQATVEPAAPVLDLGNTEIILDLDEDLEPVSLGPSSPLAPAESDEFELKLEIDDSDDETPEVEIEDLGLELEDSDTPANPEKH